MVANDENRGRRRQFLNANKALAEATGHVVYALTKWRFHPLLFHNHSNINSFPFNIWPLPQPFPLSFKNLGDGVYLYGGEPPPNQKDRIGKLARGQLKPASFLCDPLARRRKYRGLGICLGLNHSGKGILKLTMLTHGSRGIKNRAGSAAKEIF